MKAYRLNDEERSLWIDNDEGLYIWWKTSGLSKRNFLRENRHEIDSGIRRVLGGKSSTDAYEAEMRRIHGR